MNTILWKNNEIRYDHAGYVEYPELLKALKVTNRTQTLRRIGGVDTVEKTIPVSNLLRYLDKKGESLLSDLLKKAFCMYIEWHVLEYGDVQIHYDSGFNIKYEDVFKLTKPANVCQALWLMPAADKANKTVPQLGLYEYLERCRSPAAAPLLDYLKIMLGAGKDQVVEGQHFEIMGITVRYMTINDVNHINYNDIFKILPVSNLSQSLQQMGTANLREKTISEFDLYKYLGRRHNGKASEVLTIIKKHFNRITLFDPLTLKFMDSNIRYELINGTYHVYYEDALGVLGMVRHRKPAILMCGVDLTRKTVPLVSLCDYLVGSKRPHGVLLATVLKVKTGATGGFITPEITRPLIDPLKYLVSCNFDNRDQFRGLNAVVGMYQSFAARGDYAFTSYDIGYDMIVCDDRESALEIAERMGLVPL